MEEIHLPGKAAPAERRSMRPRLRSAVVINNTSDVSDAASQPNLTIFILRLVKCLEARHRFERSHLHISLLEHNIHDMFWWQLLDNPYGLPGPQWLLQLLMCCHVRLRTGL